MGKTRWASLPLSVWHTGRVRKQDHSPKSLHSGPQVSGSQVSNSQASHSQVSGPRVANPRVANPRVGSPHVAEALSVVTMNVNGIRAAYRRGMGEWLQEESPDVLLLQEVRAQPHVAEKLLGDGWDTVVHDSKIKGRSGVAVAVNRASEHVSVAADVEPVMGLVDGEEDVDTGRWLEVTLEVGGTNVRVVSAYFHAGAVGDPKQDAKMGHLDSIDQRMKEFLVEAETPQGAGENPRPTQTLVAGDFNVVRSDQDIKNWKGNYQKTSGVLDEEMEYLNRWVENGWGDTVRNLFGGGHGPYSWWSWRGRAFDNDTGWRIDYHYATPRLARGARSFQVHKAPAWDQRISDHAAITVEYLI